MKIIALLFLAFANITVLYAQKSFGFLYNIVGKQTNVETVFKNGPADKAGLQKGDVITSLNSNNLAGLNLEEVSKLFGEAKDNSIISLKRNGTAINDVKITRAERSSFLNVCVSGNCQNGEGEFIDLNGHKYTGSFSNGKKSGYGKMNYVGTRVYTGNWVNDTRQGKGNEVLENGDKYEGNFASGVYHGEGTYTSRNGEIYTGIYKSGKFDGVVTHYIKSSNETFTEIYKDGVFVSSKKIEKVIPANTNPNAKYEKLTYANGDVYEGYTVNGKRTGMGKYTGKNGGYYDGNWENDKLNGFAKYDNGYSFENNIIYEGYWKDNLMDGKINKITKNGNITEQNWVAGKLNGKSIGKEYENSTLLFTIEQQYIDDKEIGDPKVIYPNGDLYEGQWQFGKPYGIGQFTYKNGDVEKGNFQFGKKTGLIDLKTKKGIKTTQYYKNDTIAGVFAKGKLTYKNGDIYDGQWKDGLEEGAGKLITKQETITGYWKKGFLEGVAVGTSKEDGFVTTYGYRQGIIISESLNPKKFTAQIIKLVENPANKFQDVILDNKDGKYATKEKLNGFAECFVKYYPSNISSTGKEKWMYQAETESIRKAEALELCSKLEAIFENTKFSATAKKDIEYDFATRRLVNYTFGGKLPIINIDGMGGDTYWKVTIRINK